MKFDFDPTGQLICDIGKSAFGASLSAALQEIVPFDYTVVFGYHGSARPLDLYDDFPRKKRKIFDCGKINPAFCEPIDGVEALTDFDEIEDVYFINFFC